MATTTNFGWETPDDTDLVKDGAAAIRTALGGVDTSFVDLKGGTTGQVLAKASATDLDFTWATDASGIPATILDAKGDIIAATAADTAARLAVGANDTVLTADSTTATGLKWAVPSGATWTTFNPTIKQNVTISGTNYGSQYFVSGDFVFVQVNKIMGNSGTANNEIKITLPVTSTSTHLLGDGMPAGTCYIWDYSSNNYYQGFVTMYQPTEVILTSGLNKPLSTLTWGKTSSDCPITLAPDDIVSAIFSYRKA